MNHAENISIDQDEGEFILAVEDNYGIHTFNIHHLALEFYDEVRRAIGPYADEAALARAEHAQAARYVPQPVTTTVDDVYAAIDAGYALDDPKHPTYYDRMVD